MGLKMIDKASSLLVHIKLKNGHKLKQYVTIQMSKW